MTAFLTLTTVGGGTAFFTYVYAFLRVPYAYIREHHVSNVNYAARAVATALLNVHAHVNTCTWLKGIAAFGNMRRLKRRPRAASKSYVVQHFFLHLKCTC